MTIYLVNDLGNQVARTPARSHGPPTGAAVVAIGNCAEAVSLVVVVVVEVVAVCSYDNSLI